MAFQHDEEVTAVIGDEELSPSHHASSRTAYVMIIQGRLIGKTFKLHKKKMSLGRSSENDIWIDDPHISRMHALFEQRGAAWAIRDQGSRNGVTINGHKTDRMILNEGDRVQLGAELVLKFGYSDALEEKAHQHLFDSATKDTLTKIYNRKFFLEHLQNELAYHIRHKKYFSLALFDLDFFRNINNQYGHLAGDEALRSLALFILKSLRQEDVFARYGGEEFIISLRETTQEGAQITAERLRSTIETASIMYESQRLPITISVGVATIQLVKMVPVEWLIEQADGLLYEAKRTGRNRVCSRTVTYTASPEK